MKLQGKAQGPACYQLKLDILNSHAHAAGHFKKLPILMLFTDDEVFLIYKIREYPPG